MRAGIDELTFACEDALTDEARAVLVNEILEQLRTLSMDAAVVGTGFEIHSSMKATPIRVTLTQAPSVGLVVGTNTKVRVHGPMKYADARTHESLAKGSPSASLIQRATEALGDFASLVLLADWTDQIAADRSALRLSRLVGVPTDELITDLSSRLRGRSWLDEWSYRHYGIHLSDDLGINAASSLVILSGDPGTGKSVFAHNVIPSIARQLGRSVLLVQLNERLRGSGIQGRAGADVVAVIDSIGTLSSQYQIPIVAFLDEAESVTSTRGASDLGSGAQENLAVVDALIVGLDRVATREDASLLFLMATNLSDRVDPAVLRRATVVRFHRPDGEALLQLVENNFSHIFATSELARIVTALERPTLALTASDVLSQVLAPAIREAARRDRPLEIEGLIRLADAAVPTSPVAQSQR